MGQVATHTHNTFVQNPALHKQTKLNTTVEVIKLILTDSSATSEVLLWVGALVKFTGSLKSSALPLSIKRSFQNKTKMEGGGNWLV